MRVTERFKNEMERIAIEREAIATDNQKYTQQMVLQGSTVWKRKWTVHFILFSSLGGTQEGQAAIKG